MGFFFRDNTGFLNPNDYIYLLSNGSYGATSVNFYIDAYDYSGGSARQFWISASLLSNYKMRYIIKTIYNHDFPYSTDEVYNLSPHF